jgi:hypothetical protein
VDRQLASLLNLLDNPHPVPVCPVRYLAKCFNLSVLKQEFVRAAAAREGFDYMLLMMIFRICDIYVILAFFIA